MSQQLTILTRLLMWMLSKRPDIAYVSQVDEDDDNYEPSAEAAVIDQLGSILSPEEKLQMHRDLISYSFSLDSYEK